MAPVSAPTAHAGSSASSSSSSSSHRPTPPGTSDDSEAALERELDLDHPEPDVDVEWGEETDGQRGIRLQPLGGRSRHSSSRYEDGDDDDDNDGEGEEKRFLPGRRADTVQDYELYTPDEERAVLKRLDRRLVLFMGLLYMLSFLDRSSMSCARSGWAGGRKANAARCRYRQCQGRGHVEGPESQLEPIRMAAHGVLCHVHCV